MSEGDVFSSLPDDAVVVAGIVDNGGRLALFANIDSLDKMNTDQLRDSAAICSIITSAIIRMIGPMELFRGYSAIAPLCYALMLPEGVLATCFQEALAAATDEGEEADDESVE